MPLSAKRLEELTELDLQALIDEKVHERRRIDYKRLLPGKSDADKREFVADVTSFANAAVKSPGSCKRDTAQA